MMGEARETGFRRRLVDVYPGLPFLSFGLVQAWVVASVNGGLWVSPSDGIGDSISSMAILLLASLGLSLVLAACFPKPVVRLLESPKTVVVGSALATAGSLGVILSGPQYAGSLLGERLSALVGGLCLVVGGIAMAFVVLRCGELYSSLSPRRIILYFGLSYLLMGSVSCFAAAMPPWEPSPDGPTLAGMLVYVLLPLGAGWLASLPSPNSDIGGFQGASADSEPHPDMQERLSPAFWRLCIVVTIFSFVVEAVRTSMLSAATIGTIGDIFILGMFFRMLVGFVFAAGAIAIDARRIRFGRIFSLVMAAAALSIVLLPVLGVDASLWQVVPLFASALFDFVLWCLISFVACRRRAAVVRVVGLAYGFYAVGGASGWVFSTMVLPMLGGVMEAPVYTVLACLVLASTFLLFSERDFEHLFGAVADDGPTLSHLLEEDLPAVQTASPQPLSKGRFNRVIDQVSEQYGISPRERDVLRYLAMGYDANRIAEELILARNTVRVHTYNIYGKLGVHSRQELMRLVDEAKDHSEGR